MAVKQTPPPLLVRGGVAGAPVRSNIDAFDERWSEKRIRADHPTQTQEFGIGNILTAVTSNGDDKKDQESNSRRKTT